MPTKLVIGDKDGKTYQKEIADEKANALFNLKIDDEFDGGIVDVPGYKLVVRGGSDKSGFPMRKGVHGSIRKRILVSDGPGFNPKLKGMRRKKSIHGESISDDIAQVNVMVSKPGAKPLAEIFGKTEEKKEEEKKKD